MGAILCGGTFFTILTEVKKPDSRREISFMGLTGTGNEPMMLQGLMKVLNRDYIPRSSRELRCITSKFKSCQYGSGLDIPLDDPEYREGFHERVMHAYPEVCACVQDYCDTFLMAGDRERMAWLASALIELIEQDENMEGQELCVLPDGRPRSHAEICRIAWNTVNIPALLTGCLDYIVMNVRDNRIGTDTVREWMAAKQQPNMKGHVGKSIGSRYQGIISPDMRVPGFVRFRTAGPEKAGTLAWMKAGFLGMQPDAASRRQVSMPAMEPGQCARSAGTDAAPWTGTPETGCMNGGYYHLFVIDPDSLTDGSFTVPKALALSMCMDAEVRSRFLCLGEEEQAVLIGMPAVFATPNHLQKRTDETHMAILGKVTDIQLQRYDVRFRWESYQAFPQQILNRYAPRFDVWSAPATNELDEAHWSIKRAPLIALLQTMGIIGYADAVTELACRAATVS